MPTTVRMGRELRVLIVGGGISGLTLAALMCQRGMEAEIVEQTEAYGGVGYVLVLWPAGSDILKGVGLFEAFTAAAMRATSYEIRDGMGRILHTSSLATVEERFGAGYFIERATLIDILRRGVSEHALRMLVA